MSFYGNELIIRFYLCLIVLYQVLPFMNALSNAMEFANNFELDLLCDLISLLNILVCI